MTATAFATALLVRPKGLVVPRVKRRPNVQYDDELIASMIRARQCLDGMARVVEVDSPTLRAHIFARDELRELYKSRQRGYERSVASSPLHTSLGDASRQLPSNATPRAPEPASVAISPAALPCLPHAQVAPPPSPNFSPAATEGELAASSCSAEPEAAGRLAAPDAVPSAGAADNVRSMEFNLGGARLWLRVEGDLRFEATCDLRAAAALLRAMASQL